MTDAQRIDATPEVEGQGMLYSDETLKQAIRQVESALDALGKLDAKREPAEVEGQGVRYSAETLEHAIRQVESALAALKDMQPEVEGQGVRY